MKRLFAIALLWLPFVLSCSKDNPISPQQSHTVKFIVRGIVGAVDIYYDDGAGSKQLTNRLGIALPWEITFSAKSGTQISLKAYIRTAYILGGEDRSFIATLADLDGEVWLTRSATMQGSTSEIVAKVP